MHTQEVFLIKVLINGINQVCMTLFKRRVCLLESEWLAIGEDLQSSLGQTQQASERKL